MFQRYVGTHIATQDVAKHIAGSGLSSAGTLSALNVSEGGKTVANTDTTYLFNSNINGIASATGFYIAQPVANLQGYLELVSVASSAGSISGIPLQAVIMGFHTYLDLSAAPNIPINDPSMTWFPIPLSSIVQYTQAGVTTPVCNLTYEHCWPIENDPSNALYFGVACFATWGTVNIPTVGAMSLRQVTTERATFMPSK